MTSEKDRFGGSALHCALLQIPAPCGDSLFNGRMPLTKKRPLKAFAGIMMGLVMSD